MPNCFALCRKTDPTQPVNLQLIDDEMRIHFEQPPNPDQWLWHWYDVIGFRLAIGKTFDEIIKDLEEPGYEGELEAAIWLRDNFIASAWATR